MPFIAASRDGSYAVTTASFSTARPRTQTRARRVEPTPWGGGDVHHSSTRAGYQRPVSSTLVSTANRQRAGLLGDVGHDLGDKRGLDAHADVLGRSGDRAL